jgi:hypothetical protein
MRNAYKVFVSKPVGKRPFGRLRDGWEVNTEMELKEIGYEGGGLDCLRIGTSGSPL